MNTKYFPILLVFAVPAIAQEAVLTPMEDAPGSYVAAMPSEPSWRPFVNGQSVVRVTIQAPGAAACRLKFAYLGLAKDEAMYVHAAGNTVHGPYLGHGPINRPDFESQWLPGDTFAVSAVGQPTADFPFVLQSVRCQSAEQLLAAPMKFQLTFTPSTGSPAGEEVIAMVEDNLVRANRHQDGTVVLQGDMVLPAERVASGKNNTRDSNQVIGADRAWPGFRIPYVIGVMGYEDWSEYDTINAIAYWNSLFPGLLVPRTTETNYVMFQKANGVCQSAVGRAGGKQYVDIDPSCGEVAVRHEIGHVIGLWHEQMRQDRDQFVKVNYDNITTGKAHNFDIVSTDAGKNYGSYDYASLMHYGAYSFSKNGKSTLEALRPMPAGVVMGAANTASAGDIASVRTMVCNTWFIAPPNQNLEGEGDTLTLQINLPSYCAWSASETANWITLNKTSGVGPAILQVKVGPNYLGGKRQANIVINTKTTTIVQTRIGF